MGPAKNRKEVRDADNVANCERSTKIFKTDTTLVIIVLVKCQEFPCNKPLAQKNLRDILFTPQTLEFKETV